VEGLTEKMPLQRFDSIETETGLSVILIPKFGNHFVGRWLMAKLKDPHYRLNLDKIGSFVWKHCTGNFTIKEIAGALSEQFGEKVEPAEDRLNYFLQHLRRAKAIHWG